MGKGKGKSKVNIILIDMITGTVLNYDEQVMVVDVETLDEVGLALLDEWYEGGNDQDIIALGTMAGTSIVGYTPPPSTPTE